MRIGGAPQAVAGSLAHRQKRAETSDVRAERRGWVGMGPKAAWEALGLHVGSGNGTGGHAKVWLLECDQLSLYRGMYIQT